MLFDTHAHYYDKKFDADRDEILSSMKENGVGYIINAGCDVETTKRCIALAERYDFIYATAGIHPNHSFDMNDRSLDGIKMLAKHPCVKAIGEIGLDYFHKYTDREVQKEAFARQIALADELHNKAAALEAGYISEVTYIEDCLWISIESMVKLFACTATLLGDQRVLDFAQALASCAFEYGRLMLYSRELEIVNQFIESQYQLDAELEQKYAAYLEDLQKESEKFCMLINDAFAPNFRDAYLHSMLLAKASGVNEKEILSTTEDIDSFFLD